MNEAQQALTVGMGALILESKGKGVIVVGMPGKGTEFGFAPLFVNPEIMDVPETATDEERATVAHAIGQEIVALWARMREQEKAPRPRIIRPGGGPMGMTPDGEIVQ